MKVDLIRVTESAAIAASAFIGSGNKEMADKAATDAMRRRLNQLDIDGTVQLGEGIKDQAPGIFKGEKVGNGGQAFDIACDPIDGTSATANSAPEAMSVIALAGPNCLFSTEAFYMNKLAYGPQIASKCKLHIELSLEETLRTAAKALDKPLDKLMVCILNRPRHQLYITQMRQLGVRIKLIQDCDVSGAIATCYPDSGVDLLYGIGGASEAVLAACALKCLRGDFQAQLVYGQWEVSGPIYGCNDLVKGDCIFAATGITDGSLLKGVRWENKGPITHSIFMRSASGTVRHITAEHGN